MSDIKFRIAAKTDMGCIRKNNEDNFQAAADLSQPTMSWVNNQTYDLGDKGALLVVADGMGGMNAGEVASAIAIDTVREFFTPDRITPEVLKTRFTIEKFMKDVVVEADRRIKSRSTAETRGMGTTIVMAWLLDGQCYVCWCGDSRAYVYNPVNGLIQLSKDHSYVQALVDLGKITTEEAFDYPDNNVITRCLCDAHQKAEPDCLLQPRQLCNGDLILLCSDGLNGMLRDNEISKLIKEGPDDVNQLTDVLINGALTAGGNDNVTVAVARIDSGAAKAINPRITSRDIPSPIEMPAAKAPEAAATTSAADNKAVGGKGKKTPGWLWGLVGFLGAVA
ncbi:MAG: protein phosphatase 2C domain-containing protein, partial [Muribaculaceae bacterium]|nr:protein phosphatase 2C domain-containing protein [Muribaculaceae bacterium]